MSKPKEFPEQDELDSSPTREKYDPVQSEIEWKLEALDEIFSRTRDHAEEFHIRYVKPLLDAELSLETALELLVSGAFRPN